MNQKHTSTWHISCKCEYIFDSRKWNPNQKWKLINVSVSTKIQKNITRAKKVIFGILLCTCENDKYYLRFSDSIWWNYRTNKNRFNKNCSNKKYFKKKHFNKNCSNKKYFNNYHNLLTFLLITMALLIAVSIYCYLIKHLSKQKHLIPCHGTSNKLKEININIII